MADEKVSAPVWAKGTFRGEDFGHQEVCYEVVDGLAVYEGDMVIGRHEELQEARAKGILGIIPWRGRWPQRLWNDGKWYPTIPYVLELSDRTLEARVNSAMSQWQTLTPIRFKKLATNHTRKSFVTIKKEPPGKGCRADVGCLHRPQHVWLHSNCYQRTVTHELGHTIGLLHEHTRWDRDFCVKICWRNIQKGKWKNFMRRPFFGWAHGPYDYASIMHYARKEFSSGGDTIIPRRKGAVIGEGGISPGDVLAVKSMYGDGEKLPGY